MTRPAKRTFKLKTDSYRMARGGWARFLNIYCSKCHAHVLLYQKDGPGVLYRLYLDRILAPEWLASLQQVADLSAVPDLVCPACHTLIGTPYIWEEETRKAFLLDQDSFTKHIGKGVYPPE